MSNHPRVTVEQINAKIVDEKYHRLNEVLTVCVLTLENGFSVRGESACVSPENYNQELGEKYSREEAFNKIWALEGYLLKEKIFQESQPASRNIDYIAKVCHELNKAYCESLGDNSQVDWEDAPDWQKQSARMGVSLHLENPDAGPDATHESWLQQKLADGWKYGPVKDPAKKEHPCIVPFSKLSKEQQAKDFIFKQAVRSIAAIAAIE